MPDRIARQPAHAEYVDIVFNQEQTTNKTGVRVGVKAST